MKDRDVLACLVSFRIANALLCSTFFQPDEFFQSLEVAHRLVFGYGWQTWEWRPETALRSPLHPLLFVPGYWLVKVVGLEHTAVLVYAPKVLQGLIAAVNDFYTVQLAARLFPSGTHNSVALFCSVFSFFNAGVTIRAFSNSLETALTAVALSLWPWRQERSYTLSLFVAGVTCIVRPTNALLWLFLSTVSLFGGRKTAARLILDSLLPILLCTLFCLGLDSWFYGRLTFTPINFLRTNVFQQISLFYGANPWHFYLSQGIPFDTLALLPFVLHGSYTLLRQHSKPSRTAVLLALWTVLALSAISHKEFRFIQPLLPILHVAATHSLIQLGLSSRRTRQNSWLSSAKNWHLALIASINCLASIFFIAIHMRGQVSVTTHLATLPPDEVDSIGFLMPCHSTPWQSHMHMPELQQPHLAWALSCEPPLSNTPPDYVDETGLFYRDPCEYARLHLSPYSQSGELPTIALHRWPSHLVIFDVLAGHVCQSTGMPFGAVLAEEGYMEKQRFWNTFWHEDSRRDGDVILLVRPPHEDGSRVKRST